MSQKKWIDEQGLEIPGSRVTSLEKKRERYAERLLKKAIKHHDALVDFKAEAFQLCEEIFNQVMKEAGADPEKSKGNFIWYNFDRSIKVQVSISDRIDFDDALIEAAKQKFDEFLDNKLDGDDVFFRSKIMNAFSTHRGKLDTKKVFDLLRDRSKAPTKKHPYPLYHEGCELVEQAIRRPDSRKYFRIFERNKNGDYTLIDLNFSSI